MHVKTHANYDDKAYYFKMSDDSIIRYELLRDGSLLGKISENSEAQYKAIIAYVRDNLGGIPVQLSLSD